MGIFSKIFTWWDGATIGTMIATRGFDHVGTDAQGNKYYRSKKKTGDGRERRWVIYNGYAEASAIPPSWHGSYDDLPESHLPPAKIWEVDYTPNSTGTAAAYRPQGALERGGARARAAADYEAWTPDA